MILLAALAHLILLTVVVSQTKEDMLGATTSWRGRQLVLRVPKNYPKDIPLFKLEVLKASRKPSFTLPDNIPEEERKYLCNYADQYDSLDEEEPKRERRIKKNTTEQGRRQRNRGRRPNAELNGIQRSRGRGKYGSKKKKDDGVESRGGGNKDGERRGKKRNEDDILALAGQSGDLLEVHYDDKSRLASFYLRKKLKLSDYVRAEDSSLNFLVLGREGVSLKDMCNDVPEKGRNGRKGTDTWKELFSVKLTVIEPFKCNHLSENMCLLPEGQIELQQWENAAPGPLFILPSLTVLCPDVRRNIYVTMENTGLRSETQQELRYSEDDGALRTSMSLDREYRGSWLNFTLTCYIQSTSEPERKWNKTSGYLFLKDEDDCSPIRLKKQKVLWHIDDNLQHLDDMLMIIDPDEDSSSDYELRLEGDTYGIISIESVDDFHLTKDLCARETSNLPTPLSAKCSVFTPNIYFEKEDVLSRPETLNFSVVYTDTSLLSLDRNNEVWYNITLLKSLQTDNPQKSINNGVSIFHPLKSQTEDIGSVVNVSLSRPIHQYSRIAKLAKPPTFNEEKFSLSHQSKNKGIEVTPATGIVYVADSDQLERSLAEERSVEILVMWGNYNETSIFLEHSNRLNECELEHPKPSFVKVGDKLPTSCAIHSYQETCEKTCGLGSRSGGCSWRNWDGSSYMSENFATCSPDLSTCPDGFCDELEMMNKKICPQDCVEEKVLRGQSIELNKQNGNGSPGMGIKKGFGVCTCDDFCQCFNVGKGAPPRNDNVPKREKMPIGAPGNDFQICDAACQISLSVAIFIALFITAILFCRKRKNCGNKFKNSELGRPHYTSDYADDHSSSYASAPTHGEAHVVALHAVHNFNHNSPRVHNISTNSNNPEVSSDLSLVNIQVDQKWEFPRNKLTMEQTLGEGEFGKVVKARALGIAGNPGYTTVAVKMLKSNSTAAELSDLLSEYDLLKEVTHPNVVRLLGACTRKGGPVYLIMEYCKYGSLRSYLRQSRHFELESMVGSAPVEESPGDFKVTPKELISFAWQICKGMAYLSTMKLVHRDLAARNVLLAEGKICKISDFGLTRDIYEGDLYFKRSKGRVPVKWMAIESLVDHVYTSKSDVWGFGVLLWELVTLGSSPYPGVTPEALFTLLKAGHRMDKPENCSDELYQVMKQCWLENPTHRPTFAELTGIFGRMIETDIEYLELKSLIVTNRTYFDDISRTSESENTTNPVVQIKESSPESNKRETNNILTVRDEIPTDQDAYLLARSSITINPPQNQRENSELRLPVSTRTPTAVCNSINQSTNGTHLHAHNPAYSPTSEEGPPILLPIPPPLQYSTLASGPDEEEDAGGTVEENQDGCRSEGDSDSGRATGDSGYLTEEGRKSRGPTVPQSFGKPLGNARDSRGSYSPLTPHEIEDEQDTSEDLEERQELLTEDMAPMGLLTPSPSVGTRISVPIAGESRRKSPPSSSSSSSSVSPLEGVLGNHHRNRRNPVVV